MFPQQPKSAQILYSAIHENGQILLAQAKHEKHFHSENKKLLVRQIADLSFQQIGDGKLLAFFGNEYDCYVYKQDQFLYSCIVGKRMPKHVVKAFLQDTCTEHFRKDVTSLKNAVLQTILKGRMKQANDLNESDTLQQSQSTLQSVKQEALRAVQRLTDRADSLDSMRAQSEALLDTSFESRATSRRIRRTHNVNRYLIASGVLLLCILFLIVVLVLLFSQLHVWDYFVKERSERRNSYDQDDQRPVQPVEPVNPPMRA